ncbi:MAG: SDR family NAD(P)-dependent oxidoreductase [Candidatus Pacebacteria bacterium]|nr:SDR family NAD(P)-dependent oxidoreductase [Candidatus Paceibacterota bacterium]
MQTILITGIDKGIGKVIAQKFLSEDYFVIGTSLQNEVDFSDENLKVFQMDLLSDESIKNCVQEINNFNKKIDILINNAGVMVDKEETTVIKEKLRKTLEINLIGTIDFTEQILSEINEGGHIINISSSAGSMSRTGRESRMPNHYPSYKISKIALNMYTKTLALRLKDKIIVSSVHPGWVKTDMGGQEANLTIKESVENIFNFAITKPETGQFWFKGEKYPW